MRLDKYLKISRLIKRRTIADEACSAGRVLINGKVAKSGTKVQEGDIIEILFGDKVTKVQITDIKEHVRKDDAKDMYKIISHKVD